MEIKSNLPLDQASMILHGVTRDAEMIIKNYLWTVTVKWSRVSCN